MKETIIERRREVKIPGSSSFTPVSVTVVSVQREALMSSCPLISIMHRLTAVGFIFTATSLRAFGINSKCCDPSRQPVEQTATAHRAEQAVSGKSQLIFSCNNSDDTIIYMARLSAQSPLSLNDKKHSPCFLFRLILVTGSPSLSSH